MNAVPEFLSALGLDTSADARAIRRSYAQRLKQIDQATEAEAFQALRQAYEAALLWEAQRAEPEAPVASEPLTPIEPPALEPSAEPTAEPSASPAEPAEPAPDPVRLGEQAFEHWTQQGPWSNEDDAKAALEAALASDALFNLDAKHFFEWRVARWLADGWQGGHEFLFTPACQVFGWEHERQHLLQLGPVGGFIDQAIQQRLDFFRHKPEEFQRYRALVLRVRAQSEPDLEWLSQHGKKLFALADAYPHWLHVIAPMQRVHGWREHFAQALPSPVPPPSAPTKPARLEPGTPFGAGIALLALIFIVKVWLWPSPTVPSPAQFQAQVPLVPAWLPPPPPPAPAPRIERAPVATPETIGHKRFREQSATPAEVPWQQGKPPNAASAAPWP